MKQKTAYEMRISDWSSDVCSSDLTGVVVFREGVFTAGGRVEAARFNSPTATNTYPFEATRADAIIGARFTCTGTGASVARSEASGGGAAVSDNINFMTVKPPTVNIYILPTSSAGLSAGDLWHAAGPLKTVKNNTPPQPNPLRPTAAPKL